MGLWPAPAAGRSPPLPGAQRGRPGAPVLGGQEPAAHRHPWMARRAALSGASRHPAQQTPSCRASHAAGRCFSPPYDGRNKPTEQPHIRTGDANSSRIHFQAFRRSVRTGGESPSPGTPCFPGFQGAPGGRRAWRRASTWPRSTGLLRQGASSRVCAHREGFPKELAPKTVEVASPKSAAWASRLETQGGRTWSLEAAQAESPLALGGGVTLSSLGAFN